MFDLNQKLDHGVLFVPQRWVGSDAWVDDGLCPVKKASGDAVHADLERKFDKVNYIGNTQAGFAHSIDSYYSQYEFDVLLFV